MKKIYISAAIFAVLTGAAAYFFAISLEKKATVVIPMGQVVVATVPIHENTLITSDMVAVKDTALEWVAPNSITSLNDAVGKISRYYLPLGQQLSHEQLSDITSGSQGGQLSYVIEDGMRAITLSIDEAAGVGGYISKSDYVDVMTSYTIYDEEEAPDGTMEITKTYASGLLIERVRVLELGPLSANLPGQQVTGYGLITLSMKPDDALSLHYAITSGAHIYMTLRNPSDTSAGPAELFIPVPDLGR